MIIIVDEEAKKLVVSSLELGMRKGSFGANDVLGLATILTSMSDYDPGKHESDTKRQKEVKSDKK